MSGVDRAAYLFGAEHCFGADQVGRKAARRASIRDNAPLVPSFTKPLPVIDGGWPVIMADPPWHFRSYTSVPDHKSSRSAQRHYRTMTFEEIVDMRVRDVAAKDAHLWLWITGPFLHRFEEVMRAWGFKYSGSGLVWMKLKRSAGKAQMQLVRLDEINRFMLHFGMGHTTRKNVEFCLLGRRGNCRREARDVPEPIIAPVREHSRKPDEAYERVERYCGPGPKLELFSREDRDGWTVWGDQSGLLNGTVRNAG